MSLSRTSRGGVKCVPGWAGSSDGDEVSSVVVRRRPREMLMLMMHYSLLWRMGCVAGAPWLPNV